MATTRKQSNGWNPPAIADEQAISVLLPSLTPPLPWYRAHWWGATLCLAFLLATLTPLLLLVAMRTAHSRTTEAAVDFALLGFTLLSLQFVLAARFAWIEGPFGLDRLMRFHRALGITAALLLIAHPLLLIPDLGLHFLIRFRVRWYLWAGRLALATLLLHILTALLRKKIPFQYETWRRFHAAAALLLLTLGVLHSLAIGGDLTTPGAKIIWISVAASGIGSWAYSRIRPFLLRSRKRGRLFTVVSVKPENPAVWTLTLARNVHSNAAPFSHAPGQFQFIRIRRGSRWSEEHPFTIASSPDSGDEISLTIKASGDFTRQISNVQPGDLATIHGPFGRFSHLFHPEERDLVFIAGGVGITPFISMLRYMNQTRDSRRVLLLYANRSESDILFADELKKIEHDAFPSLEIVHILSHPSPTWPGQAGRLDADRISRWTKITPGKVFYFCCPSPMTTALRRGLKRHGVKSHAIRTDFFAI
jgi:predicted ferric reductase